MEDLLKFRLQWKSRLFDEDLELLADSGADGARALLDVAWAPENRALADALSGEIPLVLIPDTIPPKLLARLGFPSRIHRSNIHDFVVRVHEGIKVSHPLPFGFPESADAIARDRRAIAALEKALVKTIEDLGMFRPDTLVETWRRAAQDHPNRTQLGLSAVLNGAGLGLLGVPMHLPRARFEDPQHQYYWDTGGATLRAAVAAWMVSFMISHRHTLWSALNPQTYAFWLSYLNLTDEDLKAEQEKTFDADTVRKQQFAQFKQAYADFEGPFSETLPDPWESDFAARAAKFPASYRKEALTTWKHLQETLPEDLKAKFESSGR